MILMIPISYCLYIWMIGFGFWMIEQDWMIGWFWISTSSCSYIYIYINKPWILDDWNPSIVKVSGGHVGQETAAILSCALAATWLDFAGVAGRFLKGWKGGTCFFLNESMIEYGIQWMSTNQNGDSFWKKEWMDLTKKSWGFQPAKNQKRVFCFAVIEMDAKNLPIRPII